MNKVMSRIKIFLFLAILLAILLPIFINKLQDDHDDSSAQEEGATGVIGRLGGGNTSTHDDDSVRSKQRKNKPEARVAPVTTESGLIYQVLREGDGARPGPTDKVKVAYRGWLRSGEEFDKTQEGKPLEFPLNRVILGWQEGLQLMRVGAKYRFTIPPELGYGQRGAGTKIPPGATLMFDVELIEVK